MRPNIFKTFLNIWNNRLCLIKNRKIARISSDKGF